MCVLAFLATRNLPLCIILNAMIPFILVVLRTTRFNQKGYFVNAMGFVFLQLRPVSFAGFGKQILVYAILLIFLAAALGIVTVLKGKHREYLAVREGFGIAAKRFRSLASGERIKDISLQMASVQNSFHAGAAASTLIQTEAFHIYLRFYFREPLILSWIISSLKKNSAMRMSVSLAKWPIIWKK